MRHFEETISDAVAILVNALKNGTYRFSFYLPVPLAEEVEISPDEPSAAFIMAAVIEPAIALREREIAEGIAEDEDAIGRHDILTGRLLVRIGHYWNEVFNISYFLF